MSVHQVLGIDDVLGFEFVSPPPLDALTAALEQLLALGALDSHGDLSDTGRCMSKLPLDPSYSKALLEASHAGCLPAMLSLIAMLSVEGSAFVSPPSQRELADEAKRRFSSLQADTITLVNVYAAFGKRKGQACKQWCEQNFVNRRTLESAVQVREQLRDTCARLGLLGEGHVEAEALEATEAARRAQQGLPQVDQDTSRALRRCLTAAFFSNAAQRQPTGEYLALASRQKVAIHPSSALFSRRVACVLFNELLYTTKLYMRDLTQIDAEWLPELAPQSFQAVEKRANVPGAGGLRHVPDGPRHQPSDGVTGFGR